MSEGVGDRARRRAGAASVGVALLGGHVAWSVQLLVGWALGPLLCLPGGGSALPAFVGVTVAALLATVASGVWSHRLYARAGDDPVAARDRFVGLVGLLLDGLYAYLILMSAGGLALVGTCARPGTIP